MLFLPYLMDNGEGKERQNNVIVESHYENERKNV